MTAKPFVLIRGELVQISAASFGGNGESDWVDHAVCQDGQQRYTLRGETLAGALAATARRLVNTLPPQIGDGGAKQPSVWRTFTSHPIGNPATAVRQNVRIDKQTGAAADGALFDMETLPSETRWPFVLEIDVARAGGNAGQVMAATLHALKAWQQGYCWLGRSVARGTGWFCLENTRVAEVGWDVWPDSRLGDIGKVAAFFDGQLHAKSTELTEACLAHPLTAAGGWSKQAYQLTLTVGETADGYGLGWLSVGGHSGDVLALDIHNDLIDHEHLLMPQAPLDEAVTKTWVADHAFCFERSNGNVHPYIPGSSLRGVLRHAAEWWANKHNQPLSVLEQLFGATDGNSQAAALLVSDAHLVANGAWQAALLKMHAEDEFAGGVYASALFDRLGLVNAQFTARLVLEAKTETQQEPPQANMAQLTQALQPALELARLGWVGLGGQAARGFGQVQWHIQPLDGD